MIINAIRYDLTYFISFSNVAIQFVFLIEYIQFIVAVRKFRNGFISANTFLFNEKCDFENAVTFCNRPSANVAVVFAIEIII